MPPSAAYFDFPADVPGSEGEPAGSIPRPLIALTPWLVLPPVADDARPSSDAPGPLSPRGPLSCPRPLPALPPCCLPWRH